MSATTVARRIAAPPHDVYHALLDPDAVARWRVPDGMTAVVHDFDATVGGGFRVSLTYDEPTTRGKTDAQTDTYHGVFVELVADRRVVERIEFETDAPALQGAMSITTTLTSVTGGTEVVVEHEGIPDGLAPADNELGTRMALDKLAALVERGTRRDP